MSRADLLANARAFAAEGMDDTCTIRRRNAAADATDPDTGQITKAYVTPDLYAGKCRVQQQAQANQQDAGEDYTLLLRLEVQLPVAGTEGLQVGDEITITAAAHDQDLAGRTFLVRDLSHKTHGTARRVQVTERTD